MLVVFSSIFVADTKIIFRYNFVAPLMLDLIAVVIHRQVVDVSSHRLSSTSKQVKNHPSFICIFKQTVTGVIANWGEGERE